MAEKNVAQSLSQDIDRTASRTKTRLVWLTLGVTSANLLGLIAVGVVLLTAGHERPVGQGGLSEAEVQRIAKEASAQAGDSWDITEEAFGDRIAALESGLEGVRATLEKHGEQIDQTQIPAKLQVDSLTAKTITVGNEKREIELTPGRITLWDSQDATTVIGTKGLSISGEGDETVVEVGADTKEGHGSIILSPARGHGKVVLRAGEGAGVLVGEGDETVAGMGRTASDGDGHLVVRPARPGHGGVMLDGSGQVNVFGERDEALVLMGTSMKNGNGSLLVRAAGGHSAVMVSAEDDDKAAGGFIELFNKTNDVVVQLRADAYGNGIIGAFNREGKGETIQGAKR